MGFNSRLVVTHCLYWMTFLLGASTFNSENFPTILEHLQEPVVQLDRIVGGEEASIENYPYQCSMIVNNSFFCGCFIVSQNWLVTAAHCAQEVDPSTVVLRVGSSWRKNGTIIPIEKVIPHPEWDNPKFDKDVAVMKTAKPLEFTETVQPVILPPKGREMKGGTDVIVSGWGKTMQGNNSLPEHLMAVRIPVVPYFQCLLVYFSVLTRNMWCGGNFFLGGQGTCQELKKSVSHVNLRRNLHVIPESAYFNSGHTIVLENYESFFMLVENLTGTDSKDNWLIFNSITKLLFRQLLFDCASRMRDYNGDSGGAAVQDGMAVGIVSYGRGCGQNFSPSVFANIASPPIREFIQNHTGL